MLGLNDERQARPAAKIGIHEGPCLAWDAERPAGYFGQTVISRPVQGLAVTRSIFATDVVVNDRETAACWNPPGVSPLPQRRALRGIANEVIALRDP